MAAEDLTGIIVPLVTPFDHEEQIDLARLAMLVDFIIEQKPNYVMATALTGEGPMLTFDETILVWEEIFAATADRVGVIPAIISTRTSAAVRLAKAAHAMGAAAIMIAPIVPELYAGRSEIDVFQFHSDIAAATPLPLILFNYPSLTGVDLTPVFIARLANIETVSYVKESTGDTRRVHAIQRLCGSTLKVICGNPNAALESLALGCDTWITGIMNVAPKSAKEMLQAIILRKDLVAAREIYFNHLLPIVDIIAASNNPMGTIKAGLRARGIDVGIPRRPGTDLLAADRKEIERLVAKILMAESRIPFAA